MINLDWQISLLVLAPFVAFIISILGIFDIKKESAERLFKECLKKLRSEKIKIWKKLLLIQSSSLVENEFEEQLAKILEDEERFIGLSLSLQCCRRYFDFYYKSMSYIFVGGMLTGLIKILSPNFFLNDSVIVFLSIIAIVSSVFAIVGIVILKNKKDQLDESFEKIIASSSSSIKF